MSVTQAVQSSGWTCLHYNDGEIVSTRHCLHQWTEKRKMSHYRNINCIDKTDTTAVFHLPVVEYVLFSYVYKTFYITDLMLNSKSIFA